MPRPNRIIRLLIAIALAGSGRPGFGQTLESPASSNFAPVTASSDAMSGRISQTGLVRIIEDDAARRTQAIGPVADPNGLAIAAPMNESAKGPIELTPLSVPNTDVQGIGTGVQPEDATIDRMPPPLSIPTGETRDGNWGLQSKGWVPGGFCHQPLYFEDPMLERHGHTRHSCLQPFASGLRFFGTIPSLPYLATLRYPLDEVHTLGAYRPGTAAPKLRYRAHYDLAGLRNQFLVTAGLAAGIP